MKRYFKARPILFVVLLSLMSVSFAGCDAAAIISAVQKIIEGVSAIGSAITGSSGTAKTASDTAKTAATETKKTDTETKKADADTKKTDTETKKADAGSEAGKNEKTKATTPTANVSPSKATANGDQTTNSVLNTKIPSVPSIEETAKKALSADGYMEFKNSQPAQSSGNAAETSEGK
ncbi:MAG: hypothetical protein WA705_28285 [Candidatus Ozemobacteraceae bacterium]